MKKKGEDELDKTQSCCQEQRKELEVHCIKRANWELSLHSVAQLWTLSAFNHFSLFNFTSQDLLHIAHSAIASVSVYHLNSGTWQRIHLAFRIYEFNHTSKNKTAVHRGK